MNVDHIMQGNHTPALRAALLLLVQRDGDVRCQADHCVSHDREIDSWAKGTQRRGAQTVISDDGIVTVEHAGCARSRTAGRLRKPQTRVTERGGFKLDDKVRTRDGREGVIKLMPVDKPTIVSVHRELGSPFLADISELEVVS